MEEEKDGCVTTEDVYDLLYKGLSRKSLSYKGKKYDRAFYFKDAVKYLVQNKITETEETAKDYMDELMESNYLYLLNGNLHPAESELLCRFRKDNPDHGHQPDKNKTWSLVLKQAETNSFISLKGVTDFHEKCPFVTSMFLDQHNCKLYDAIRPVEWADPIPSEPYDLVVIGGGAGGIAAAIKAVQKNSKVALIERCYIGGEHYNTGMIAFSALEQCAEIVQKLSEARILGLEVPKEAWGINIKKIMEQVRLKRSQITPQFCNIFAFTDTYGIDVFLGNGKFVGPQRVMVNDRVLEFSKAIVATGTQPTIPKLEGLANVPYYTIETIYNMTKRPSKLAIYGWGRMACAYAQVFQRMLVDVTLLCEEKKVIDCDALEGLNKYTEDTLKDLGVKVLTGATVSKIETRKGQTTEYTISADVKGVQHVIACQAILIATPKTPCVAGLGLETANICYDVETGIIIDDFLKTTNDNVYAIGDVTALNLLKTSYISEYFGEIAVKNALFNKKIKVNTNHIPLIINVYPKIAAVGMLEERLDQENIDYDIYIEHNKLAIKPLITGEDRGFVKIITKKGTYDILGALIISAKADELINEVALAIKLGIKLNQIEKSIFVNGTFNESFLHIAQAAKYKKHSKGKQFSLLKNPVDIDHNDKLVFGYMSKGHTTFGPAFFK